MQLENITNSTKSMHLVHWIFEFRVEISYKLIILIEFSN